MLEDARQLLAPTLVRAEVAAALVKKAQRREMPVDACSKVGDLWRRTLGADRIVLISDELDLEAASSIALHLAHPLPDCLYLALSIRLGVPLLTADQQFARGAQETYPRIELLGASSAPSS